MPHEHPVHQDVEGRSDQEDVSSGDKETLGLHEALAALEGREPGDAHDDYAQVETF